MCPMTFYLPAYVLFHLLGGGSEESVGAYASSVDQSVVHLMAAPGAGQSVTKLSPILFDSGIVNTSSNYLVCHVL